MSLDRIFVAFFVGFWFGTAYSGWRISRSVKRTLHAVSPQWLKERRQTHGHEFTR